VQRGRVFFSPVAAAQALFNLTFHDAGERQAEGLGYTRERLMDLCPAKHNSISGNKRRRTCGNPTSEGGE
jgi:hypothetical protein